MKVGDQNLLVTTLMNDDVLADLRLILERKIAHRRGAYRAAYMDMVAAIDAVLPHKPPKEEAFTEIPAVQ
jgi:hypothetical protein